jgi:hypothetical protein
LRSQACQRLYDFGRIYVIKIGGTPYIGLADPIDAEIAAHYRQRQLRASRLRRRRLRCLAGFGRSAS